MTISTRRGDEGRTQRIDGSEVSKSHPQMQAIGAIDELNACIGWCLAYIQDDQPHREIAEFLQHTPHDLLTIGSSLAGSDCKLTEDSVQTVQDGLETVESRIDPLKAFILPAGCELACRLHMARTICRRVERIIAEYRDGGGKTDQLAHRYLNRLADLLFVLARLANRHHGISDTPWRCDGSGA